MKIRWCVLILSFLFILPAAQAKVYWIGRNIDLSPSDVEKETYKMLKDMGHSYIVIVPDDPEKVRMYSFAYVAEERSLGCGEKRGVIIGAYPENGSKKLGNLDGNLTAEINAPREFVPTQHYFCGTPKQKQQWNFVGGEVTSDLPEEEFIDTLIIKTYHYQTNTRIHPVDYHAFRSIIDANSRKDELAQNCNAFAWSLLVWSYASHAPDLGETRNMPGQRNLLSEGLFSKGPSFRDAEKDNIPPLIKNDSSYRNRLEMERLITGRIALGKLPTPFSKKKK